jgi:hypothetical protein
VKEFEANAVETARGSQVTFSLIDPKDPTFEFDLEHWFKSFEARSGAGVFFVATKGKAEGEPGEILVFHHWLVMEGTLTPDMIGIESFEAAATFKGVKSVELFGKLIPHKGARKAGASDFFVPSLDGLIDGLHPLKGKFVPGAKDACLTIQALESKVNGVLVPVPIAQMLLGDEVDLEDSDDEGEESTEVFNPKDPMHLLKRLVKVMKYKREKEGNWYKNWKTIAEEVVTLLWATANGFAVGVEVLPAEINRQALRHQVKCAQELIASDQELYGDEDEDENKQGEDESIREKRSRGQESGGSVLGLELLTRGSPRSKGTASPSARRDRAGVSFEDPHSTDGEEREETKEPDPIEVVEGGRRVPGDSPDMGLPAETPEWAGHMAGQFMADS